MFTVIPATRNSNLHLVSALAIMVIILFATVAAHPLFNASVSPSRETSPLASPAFYEYRRGEWSPFVRGSGIGSEAFYEYRRGEWTPIVATSFIGSAVFYAYRQGEWSINLNPNREASNSAFRQGERTASLSPGLRDVSNYLYRQGEWFGK